MYDQIIHLICLVILPLIIFVGVKTVSVAQSIQEPTYLLFFLLLVSYFSLLGNILTGICP